MNATETEARPALRPALLTPAEASAYTRYSRWKLNRLRKAGKIKTVGAGRGLRYPVADLDRFVEKSAARR